MEGYSPTGSPLLGMTAANQVTQTPNNPSCPTLNILGSFLHFSGFDSFENMSHLTKDRLTFERWLS